MNRYVKIENGLIVEPYVTDVQIANRGHHSSIYTLVKVDEKPKVGKFQYLKEDLKIKDGSVYLNWIVANKSLDMVLEELHKSRSEIDDELPDIIVTTVDQETVNHIIGLVKDHITVKLNAFAKSRDYDDIVSLTSYATSGNPKFSAEGLRGVELRDACYAALYSYLDEMLQGVKFAPKSTAEIDTVLPDFTWN